MAKGHNSEIEFGIAAFRQSDACKRRYQGHDVVVVEVGVGAATQSIQIVIGIGTARGQVCNHGNHGVGPGEIGVVDNIIINTILVRVNIHIELH